MAVLANGSELSCMWVVFFMACRANDTASLKSRIRAVAIGAWKFIVHAFEFEEAEIVDLFALGHAKTLLIVTACAVDSLRSVVNVYMAVCAVGCGNIGSRRRNFVVRQ